MSLSKIIFGNPASHIFFGKLYSLAECIMGWCSLDFILCKEWIIKHLLTEKWIQICSSGAYQASRTYKNAFLSLFLETAHWNRDTENTEIMKFWITIWFGCVLVFWCCKTCKLTYVIVLWITLKKSGNFLRTLICKNCNNCRYWKNCKVVLFWISIFWSLNVMQPWEEKERPLTKKAPLNLQIHNSSHCMPKFLTNNEKIHEKGEK